LLCDYPVSNYYQPHAQKNPEKCSVNRKKQKKNLERLCGRALGKQGISNGIYNFPFVHRAFGTRIALLLEGTVNEIKALTVISSRQSGIATLE